MSNSQYKLRRRKKEEKKKRKKSRRAPKDNASNARKEAGALHQLESEKEPVPLYGVVSLRTRGEATQHVHISRWQDTGILSRYF